MASSTSFWKVFFGIIAAICFVGVLGVGACVLLISRGTSSLREAREQANAQATRTASQPTATPRATGYWSTSFDKSQLDDSQTVYMQVDADTSINAWPGETHKPTLWIRCQQRKTEVAVTTGTAPNPEVGNYDSATVTLRLDDSAAFKVNAGKSTDGKALFLGGSTRAKQLLGHKRLLFQFTPFNSDPQTTTFQIVGLDEAIKPLRKACGW